MKKAAVIVTASLGALALALAAGAYVWLFGGAESDLEGAKLSITQGVSDAKGDEPIAGGGEGQPSELSGKEKPSAVQEAIARIAPSEYKRKVDGAMTELLLRDGDIGYLDVESLVQNGDPYSVIALLQEHEVLTGVPKTDGLEMESVVMRTPRGYVALYDQIIGGVATPGEGSVAFDSSGSVYDLHSRLVTTGGAKPNSVSITRSEAKHLAREAIARYVETSVPS